eukprot:1641502-Pleurochrysis_carterae.AAC.3
MGLKLKGQLMWHVRAGMKVPTLLQASQDSALRFAAQRSTGERCQLQYTKYHAKAIFTCDPDPSTRPYVLLSDLTSCTPGSDRRQNEQD